ncbi:hypothetical protein [Pontibacillus salipaludis]|uniref:hypothetical protein n=1 Tax=Pontibacillus salipaludis TaxID=1697394 RepID=UPI0031F07935
MARYKEITVDHDFSSSVILNVTNQEIDLTPDLILKSGEHQIIRVEGKKGGCETLFHIIHPFKEWEAVTLLSIPLREPPPGETYFQFLHLNPSTQPVSVKARYGDVLHRNLQYKTAIEPILLYTPMDVPLDITKSEEAKTISLEGYVTRPNVYTIGIYVGDEASPYWIVHIRSAKSTN